MSKMADSCVVCGNDNLQRIKGFVAPFLIERMFDGDKNIKSDIFYCSNCNFYFSEIRPDDKEMDKYYESYHDGSYLIQRKKIEPDFYTDELVASLKQNKVIRKKYLTKYLLDKLSPSKIKNVLDYGGGNGEIIPDFFTDKYIYDIGGVEKLEGITRIPSIEDLKKYSFDFIMCNHVLEHLSYPMEVVELLLSILSDGGGHLYIEVPYEDYFYKFENSIIHEHINFFRKETFEKIFDRYNIAVLDIVEDNKVSCLIKKVSDTEAFLFKKLNYQNKILSQIKDTLNILDESRLFSLRKKKDRVLIKFFGIRITLLCSKLAWWIPVRKWRDNFRNNF